jgi:drug/metabolite transporter (DMT)-like permease
VALFLRKEKAGSPIASIVLGNLIVALAGLPFMLSAPSLGGYGLPRLLLLGTVQLGLPYVFYAAAIKHVTALEATLIPLLEPVLNPLWVMLALGEQPGPWAILGALLVLGAVLGRGLMMTKGRRGIPAGA